MNYKNQILKQLASGSFGKKTYMDIVRNKGSNSRDKSKVFTNSVDAEEDVENSGKIYDTNEEIVKTDSNTGIAEDTNIFIKKIENYSPNLTDSTIKRLVSLESQMLELEDYIVVVASEIEKLKNSQKNMIDVINKLSNELISAKNNIIR